MRRKHERNHSAAVSRVKVVDHLEEAYVLEETSFDVLIVQELGENDKLLS